MNDIWEYDEDSFTFAARVVLKINQHALKRFRDEETLVAWMKSESKVMAESYAPLPELVNDHLTNWGTYGFHVSICLRKNGSRYAQASLNPYLVAEALKISTW